MWDYKTKKSIFFFKRVWLKAYHEKSDGAKIYLGGDRSNEIKGYDDACVCQMLMWNK